MIIDNRRNSLAYYLFLLRRRTRLGMGCYSLSRGVNVHCTSLWPAQRYLRSQNRPADRGGDVHSVRRLDRPLLRG